jgi:hypothetical protein
MNAKPNWTATHEPHTIDAWCIMDDDGYYVATLHAAAPGDNAQKAHVMAAGFDMLEALEITEAAHDDDTRIAASKARQAAIAKAKGGQGE